MAGTQSRARSLHRSAPIVCRPIFRARKVFAPIEKSHEQNHKLQPGYPRYGLGKSMKYLVEVITVGPRMAVDTAVPKQCEQGSLQLASVKTTVTVPEAVPRYFQFILQENVGGPPHGQQHDFGCVVFSSRWTRSDRILSC